ncbi:hypothetical protein ACFWY9_12435 [Amycolatopsis sp. NPDC059027]
MSIVDMVVIVPLDAGLGPISEVPVRATYGSRAFRTLNRFG